MEGMRKDKLSEEESIVRRICSIIFWEFCWELFFFFFGEDVIGEGILGFFFFYFDEVRIMEWEEVGVIGSRYGVIKVVKYVGVSISMCG